MQLYVLSLSNIYTVWDIASNTNEPSVAIMTGIWLFWQGGMKAVVWTDVFQGLVMFAGVIAVLIVVCYSVSCNIKSLLNF